jgi:hypothetical protein
MPVVVRHATPLRVASLPDAATAGARLSGLRPMHDPESARGGPTAFGRIDARPCVLTGSPAAAARRAGLPIESEQP